MASRPKRANTSADKSREELWRWQQTDPSGLVDYTFQLQAEVRHLRDRADQNSRNSSRPPATDGVEQPKPKSLRKRSGRKPSSLSAVAVAILTASNNAIPEEHWDFALSDVTTVITTGTAKPSWYTPYAITLTSIPYAWLTTASSSGTPTINIKEAGGGILSTKITIDANELTSGTAATPAVLSDTSLAANALITFDIDVAGTGVLQG